MRKRKSIYILVLLFILTLVGVVGFYLSARSPILGCYEWGFSQNSPKYYINPEKVVVKPWHGQHHVFAIFMIPGGYLNEKLFTLNLSGDQRFCGILAYAGTTDAEGISAKPGHYLMKGLLNTRTALWIISQGKGGELEQASNWRIGYSKGK
ncbi:hypothetical protein [Calothrix sp. PCC 6303]|uniref:hypothetical protein n=1 Tax=Calothrix sp. PCC 6303 TaxID=1170562 RepID=UPI0002A03741|nr:hypothetical protein [Calothrix sp. PCC 6303]AFY99786.1 hypothetical protein Cal6303_0716 [Calothrix sp. PCC 6303]